MLSTFIVKYRRIQDRATQIANADVAFYYMPWMSIDGMLDAMDVYNQAILDYATRAACPCRRPERSLADAEHFTDCMHLPTRVPRHGRPVFRFPHRFKRFWMRASRTHRTGSGAR